VGVFVEAAEERVVVEDVPEAVGDLFESDVFMVEAWLKKCCPECRRKVPAPLTFRTSKWPGYSGGARRSG
jgi:hypothetical protein